MRVRVVDVLDVHVAGGGGGGAVVTCHVKYLALSYFFKHLISARFVDGIRATFL